MIGASLTGLGRPMAEAGSAASLVASVPSACLGFGMREELVACASHEQFKFTVPTRKALPNLQS
eukprot:2397863-Amphidinium_carterae.2